MTASARRIDFVWVAEVRSDHRLSSTARLLACHLVDRYMNKSKGWIAWPTMRRLADDLGLSHATISRRIAELRALNYLDVVVRKTKAGCSYIYKMIFGAGSKPTLQLASDDLPDDEGAAPPSDFRDGRPPVPPVAAPSSAPSQTDAPRARVQEPTPPPVSPSGGGASPPPQRPEPQRPPAPDRSDWYGFDLWLTDQCNRHAIDISPPQAMGIAMRLGEALTCAQAKRYVLATLVNLDGKPRNYVCACLTKQKHIDKFLVDDVYIPPAQQAPHQKQHQQPPSNAYRDDEARTAFMREWNLKHFGTWDGEIPDEIPS